MQHLHDPGPLADDLTRASSRNRHRPGAISLRPGPSVSGAAKPDPTLARLQLALKTGRLRLARIEDRLAQTQLSVLPLVLPGVEPEKTDQRSVDPGRSVADRLLQRLPRAQHRPQAAIASRSGSPSSLRSSTLAMPSAAAAVSIAAGPSRPATGTANRRHGQHRRTGARRPGHILAAAGILIRPALPIPDRARLRPSRNLRAELIVALQQQRIDEASHGLCERHVDLLWWRHADAAVHLGRSTGYPDGTSAAVGHRVGPSRQATGTANRRGGQHRERPDRPAHPRPAPRRGRRDPGRGHPAAAAQARQVPATGEQVRLDFSPEPKHACVDRMVDGETPHDRSSIAAQLARPAEAADTRPARRCGTSYYGKPAPASAART